MKKDKDWSEVKQTVDSREYRKKYILDDILYPLGY